MSASTAVQPTQCKVLLVEDHPMFRERMAVLINKDLGMKQEWVEAIKANKPSIALSNFDYAALLTETILLGNVAMRVGQKFEWDGPNLKATNCPEADALISPKMHNGYTL